MNTTIWSEVIWTIARAGGFTAYLLLTLSVVVGLALSLHLQSDRWPRLINSELHNFLSLLGLIFTIVHVLAVWIDPFTKFGWSEVFIPLVSHYRTVGVALGITALYLGIAIGISTWLRPRIGYQWWRRLHVLTLLIFALVTIHGIVTGSNSNTWWAIGMYSVSSTLVSILLVLRLRKTAKAKHHPAPALSAHKKMDQPQIMVHAKAR
jgi:predicted ferric reductase